MRCAISTGEYVDEEVRINECGLQEAPVDPSILFDGNSTSRESRTFNIIDGECALLTAYSNCGCTVCVEKLLMSKPNLPLSNGSCECAPPAVPQPVPIAVTPICNWCLGECAEIRHICVPGTYRLQIVGPDSCIGCVTVTMERVAKGATPIPTGLVFGASCAA